MASSRQLFDRLWRHLVIEMPWVSQSEELALKQEMTESDIFLFLYCNACLHFIVNEDKSPTPLFLNKIKFLIFTKQIELFQHVVNFHLLREQCCYTRHLQEDELKRRRLFSFCRLPNSGHENWEVRACIQKVSLRADFMFQLKRRTFVSSRAHISFIE